MIRIFTRQIEKLGTEEGQALVFIAMVGMVMFLFLAMSLNLAELINIKIKNQNVADATALSGAVWQARALNMISATNQNIIAFWVAFIAHNSVALMFAIGLGILFCNVDNPLEVPLCLMVIAFVAVMMASSMTWAMSAFLTGQLQADIENVIDIDLLDRDLASGLFNVVDHNYGFKQNTSAVYNDPQSTNNNYTGAVFYVREVNNKILDGFFRRAGFCELITAIGYYLLRNNFITLADWNTLRPYVDTAYTSGWCDPNFDPLQLLQGTPAEFLLQVLPLMLNTRDPGAANPANNIEWLMPITVGTFRDRTPPILLGTGEDYGDCSHDPSAGVSNTTFPCPQYRHYSFASAHAYSESVAFFYRVAAAGVSPNYPIPMVPIEMDWGPRLFPIEPYPIANRFAADWRTQWNPRDWEPPLANLALAGPSPNGGWNAFCGNVGACLPDTLADQLDVLFPGEEQVLREHTLNLVLGWGARPFYFLY